MIRDIESNDSQDIIIDAKEVSKVFGRGEKKVVALKDVSFKVKRKEFVAVIGPSGCGKTTLLRIVAGLLPKTSGSVFVNNAPLEGPIEDIGIVFQSPVLLPWRVAIQNVMLPVEIYNLDREKYYSKAMELMDFVGLGGFEFKYPHELSGGMQQRVSLCRALIHDPLLLLMDEPFGALDAMTREKMNMELLRIWEEQQKTIIFVTHSVSEAVFLADRVIILSCRPATVRDIIEIDLARPRDWDITGIDPRFSKYIKEMRRKIG